MALAAMLIAQFSFAQTNGDSSKVPQVFKVNREGVEPKLEGAEKYLLNVLNEGTDKPVFADCPDGPHYVAFQLYYDLRGHSNTTVNWSVNLDLKLIKGNDTIWTKPLYVESSTQTNIATVFHDQLITCNEDYHFYISKKSTTGTVPSDFIELKVLLYKNSTDEFNPSQSLALAYQYNAGLDRNEVSWSYSGNAVLSYDLEWVFIDSLNSSAIGSVTEAFDSKEPVRISTAGRLYNHLAYYSTGKICYRVRAVGYNPLYPTHRIPGQWSYYSEGEPFIEITNHQPDMSWQQQSVFAEEGKSKTLMHYYDESLRQRQSLTNLSTENVTLVADALYDFEGRKSVDILPVPATDATLKFHAGFNKFQPTDPVVTSNTSAVQKKFHYDNQGAENSMLDNTSGAGNYYSPSSNYTSVHKDMIPDGEGHVYSQTEFMRDGTGRVSKQSGVGKEFRTDGAHTTRYHYGETTQEELVRLFGSNVGNASHYKKNLVIDPNGQGSVSYLDQEGRVIATALAGDKPANVEALDSLTYIKTDPLTVDVLHKNRVEGNISRASHKILNVLPTAYTFRYELSALASEIETVGCQNCVFDLALTLTDPDGTSVDLSSFAGNQSENSFSYSRHDIIAANCTLPSVTDDIEIGITLAELGEYTFTKTLTARELTFDQLQQLAMQDESVLDQIETLKEYYVSDSTDCETCYNACPGSDEIIDEAIVDIANLDCDNILQQIMNDLRTAHQDNPEYEPAQSEVEQHVLYCKYTLCTKNVTSDMFDKKLARVQSWSQGQIAFSNALDSDPFFTNGALSGAGSKSSMSDKLNNVDLGVIGYDYDGDGEDDNFIRYSGAIGDVTDPTNTDYYIDVNGKPDVNGFHILYLDIMGNRDKMEETAYLAELSRQHWTMFRTFYLEAKRKTKLELNDYQLCAAAMDELRILDQMKEVDSEEEMLNWAQQNNALGYDQVSTEGLEMSLESIRMSCNTTFTGPDSLAISNHLKAYFESDPQNYFRIIQTEDLQDNDDLAAIQVVLNNYNCKLDSVAFAKIQVCLKDTTVTVNYGYQPSFVHPFAALNNEQDHNQDQPGYNTRWVEMDSLYSNRFHTVSEVSVHANTLSAGLSISMMSVTIPSQAEYDALISFYTSTGGPSHWDDKTGWSELSAGPAQDISALVGVVLDGEGHVVEINLPGNNLTGSLPSTLGDLNHLRHLRLGRRSVTVGWSTTYYYNNISGAIPVSIQNLDNLITLTLDYNNFSGVSLPTEIGGLNNLEYLYLNDQKLTKFTGAIPFTIGDLSHLKELKLENNNFSGDLPSSIGNLTNLVILNLEGNSVTGSLPDFTGLTALTTLNLIDNSLTGSIPASIGYASNLKYLYLTRNELTGSIPATLGSLSMLEELYLMSNELSGALPSSLGSLEKLRILQLGYNTLNNSLPSSLGQLTDLTWCDLSNNAFTGAIPPSIGQLTNLEVLWLHNNALSDSIPGEVGSLVSLTTLYLNDNQLVGSIPVGIGNLINLTYLDLSNNILTGSLPVEFEDLANLNMLSVGNNQLSGKLPIIMQEHGGEIDIRNNNFTFSDIVDLWYTRDDWNYCSGGEGGSCLQYAPQDSVDVVRTFNQYKGQPLTLHAEVDLNVPGCEFEWFRHIEGQPDVYVASGQSMYIYNTKKSHSGDYYYRITNEDLWDLELTSRLQTVVVEDTIGYVKDYALCLQYDTANTTLRKFSFEIDWNKAFVACMNNAANEDSTLVAYATEKLIENYISNLYSSYRTTCLANAKEKLTYTYIPKEYHYTLYYYDQAANLVQTVPPNGVHPLSNLQVEQFMAGVTMNPQHTLITVYQYNSLNQLIWQKTPDAGESQFWYNEKGQLKLSQNAQQLLDSAYSYTKYDEQGRIGEVGEMTTEEPLNTLSVKLDSVGFPLSNAYALSDITRTHYDRAKSDIASEFPQSYLRSRVSWVEVIDKGSTDTTSTYYTYDIHGNVKALLQSIPGLEAKRTDYVYDLVSGKVNYVMYQYGKDDQFMHKYDYDDDNRLTEVHTSSDGFLWDRDAAYKYYKHGPLARVELGEYRVQGLDYYYTLQGWIKGVNTPFADDPDVTNIEDEGVGKDVFAYALGYYQGDYKPINTNLGTVDTRDQLWTRQNETFNHTGLYNGNISWMITDLSKIGEINNDRKKGMQAMLYQYDQLHRILKSRSLTNYTTSGFAARTTTGAYDEDYAYDPNGNIMTLQRRNELNALADDFHYMYYPNSNKLREVKPVTKDKVYGSGELKPDNILYRNVTIEGKAYVSSGKTAEVKALENIFVDPDFEAKPGSDFWAHIVEDDGTYQYDAIGNLIKDQDEGVLISWTPYGKVRAVHTKGDSINVYFRYDASGNRVEKKVVRRDTVDNVSITRYVRDASGNVMTIYNDSVATEQPLYGSSRLGQFNGSRKEGYQILRSRKFELSNHLGNVLAVIRDDANVTADSAWAAVASTSDYYPFGLEMKGRTFIDSTSYRYGFNGKEKDYKGEFGEVSYDYGFRIYNPAIGKFLSVDPLTKSYPMLTPYQFASNTPIQAIDLDGLEALIVTFPEYKADPELQVTVWGKTLKAPKVPSGHAGVLLIEPNGATRYFEYGRYKSADGVPGITRKVHLENDVIFGKDGLPTNESLNKVLGEISNISGAGGRIRAAYIETSEIEKMIDYAKRKVIENSDPKRKPYSVPSNNCGTFAADCITQDPTVDQPTIYNPTPNNIVDEYLEEGNREIQYDPKTKTTTIGAGDEGDAKIPQGQKKVVNSKNN